MICPKSLESTRVRARTSKVSALSERVHQENSSRAVVRARPALYLEKQAWATDASAQERHTKMGSGTKANGTAGRVQACVCVVDCGFGGGREVWRVAMLPLEPLLSARCFRSSARSTVRLSRLSPSGSQPVSTSASITTFKPCHLAHLSPRHLSPLVRCRQDRDFSTLRVYRAVLSQWRFPRIQCRRLDQHLIYLSSSPEGALPYATSIRQPPALEEEGDMPVLPR